MLFEVMDADHDRLVSYNEFFNTMVGQPPSYNEAVRAAPLPPPSAAEFKAPPPIQYNDLRAQLGSFLPNMPVGALFYDSVAYVPPPPLFACPFAGEVKKSDFGYTACSGELNTVDRLMSFFKSYSQRPGFIITVWGFHYERRRSSRKRGSRQVTVTDFKYFYDLSQYVANDALWDENKAQQAVLSFVKREDVLGDLTLHKKVAWDFGRVSQAIEDRIRMIGKARSLKKTKNEKKIQHSFSACIGYPSNIRVAASVVDSHVTVRSSNPVGVCCRSTLCDCFAVITCLCILFYPIKYAIQNKTEIESFYKLNISEDEAINQILPSLHI